MHDIHDDLVVEADVVLQLKAESAGCIAMQLTLVAAFRDFGDGVCVSIFTGSLENLGESRDGWVSEATMELSNLRLGEVKNGGLSDVKGPPRVTPASHNRYLLRTLNEQILNVVEFDT